MSHKSIPAIQPSTYDLAHQCCLQLWVGVNYSNGRSQVSDAEMLNTWTGKYQNAVVKNIRPKFSQDDFNRFASATKVGRFLQVNNLFVAKLNSAFDQTVRNLYSHSSVKSDEYSDKLGKDIASTTLGNGKVIVASRALFFALPDRRIFNMNGRLADALGIKRHRNDFSSVLTNEIDLVYQKDWTQLIKYQMPMRTSEIKLDIWKLACNNGWWQRKVLDIAILLEMKLTSAAYTHQQLAYKQTPIKI